MERPGLSRLREDVKSGIVDKIYCYDPDRLSRKLMNQLILDDELRKAGAELIFVNGEYARSPEGKLFFSMRGAISEFEKEKIKQRMKSGKIRKVKEGKVLGNYGLYGYDYDRDKKTYVINEEQAKVVKMIFDYFTDPASPFKGINGIAKHLTDMGVPTAKNKGVWHRQVVRQILLNESYTGNHPQNKHDTEGDYVRVQSGEKREQTLRPKEEWIYVKIPPIISEEQYSAAQNLIKQSRRRSAKESQHKYLLSGLIRCADCGNTMTGMMRSWWGKKIPMYSDQKNYSGAKHPGCGNFMRTEELDKYVWEKVLFFLNHPEKILERTKNASPKAKKYQQQELEHLEKELEKIKKGRKNLISLAAMSEGTDLIEIKEQLTDLKMKEESLQEQYNRLNKEIKQEERGNDSIEHFKRVIKMYITNEDREFDFESKQTLIRTIVKQIYVSKENDNIDIEIF
ncbi:hypothetical protein SD77_2070 [Bacillus badius]|uniref:DNA recombinase n=2 Tax=Bacillus badius TaxID=1455 RepID=A0ABR5AY05_BACBA|nr:hypothetical protein SD77_2070 [Bacillus badius]